MQEGKILAASQDGAYVIRLVGDVRLTLCTTIDEYFARMYEDPEFASVWVDLTAAQGVDSTTLGMLAKLALEVKKRFGFRPAIYACDPGILRLLQSMAFHRLFEVRKEKCANPGEMAPVPAVDRGEDELREKVIEAHRVLMGLSAENRERFQDLMNVLEQG
ncbi:MAG: STAS domain-containing protein [Gammaproteobacteria bacterium]|nr:STAS domain-containing protein [Gammaproteobacteria bacterium]